MKRILLLAVCLLTSIGIIPEQLQADPCGMVPPIYAGNVVPINRIGRADSVQHLPQRIVGALLAQPRYQRGTSVELEWNVPIACYGQVVAVAIKRVGAASGCIVRLQTERF